MKNRFSILHALLCGVVIGLLAFTSPPAQAQVTARSSTSFPNFPTLLSAGGVSNATVNAYTYSSNAIPIVHGKGLGLAFEYTQASNAQNATVTHYFGVIYNTTSYTKQTNFTWNITTGAIAGSARSWFTNIPASVLDNADAVFWYSTQNGCTNSLTNCVLRALGPG